MKSSNQKNSEGQWVNLMIEKTENQYEVLSSNCLKMHMLNLELFGTVKYIQTTQKA